MEQEKKSRLKRNIKLFFGTVAIATLLGFGGWYYWQTQQEIEAKDVALRSLKLNVRQDLETQHNSQYAGFLKLLMEPFGWAIRTEMLSGNIATVHQYLAQFVKNPTVELIAVINADDKIISCTDKKIEGKNFSVAFPDSQFKTNAFKVTSKGNRHYVIQPIMGFDDKIGAIFLIYLSEEEDWLPPSLKNLSP